MNEVVTELISYLKTKDALAYFINRIDTAMLELSSSDIKHLDLYFTLKEIAVIVKVVKNLDDLKMLREELMQTAVITVKIAFRASAYFETTLTETILKSCKEPCVSQIVFDRRILGGAIIDFKGRYRDYSVRGSIDEWRRRKM